MADDKQSGSGLGGSVILLLAAVVSAVYVGWHSPLVSTRPIEGDYDISQTKTAQDIDARLWQDPVGAVERAIEDKRNAKVDPAAGHCLADFRNLLDKSGSTLLIGVSLPGDPYPEADETRRRLRYAVLSALHVSHYVPVDERHIGYMLTNEKPKPAATSDLEMVASGYHSVTELGEADPPTKRLFGVPVFEPTTNCVVKAEETGPNQLSVPAIVPFEQYEFAAAEPNAAEPKEGEATGHKRIMVLWIDEEALAHGLTPIASLASLLCDLQVNHKDDRFVFIGPQDSNILQTMVQEIKDNHYSKDNNPLNKICKSTSETSSAIEATAPSASEKSQADKSVMGQPPIPLGDDMTVYNFGATAEDDIILKNADVDPQRLTSKLCSIRVGCAITARSVRMKRSPKFSPKS